MEKLVIKNTSEEEYTIKPDVIFDPDTGVCSITGNSFMHHAHFFYETVIEWLRKYLELRDTKLLLIVKLDYYNTGTYKSLGEIFDMLKEFMDKGKEITVDWYLYDEDEGAKEDLNDLNDGVGLNVNFKYF